MFCERPAQSVVRGRSRHDLRSRVLLLCLVVAFAVLPALSFAGPKANVNPGVMPPWAHPHGLTYGQWAFPIPAAVNPMLTDGVVDASIGQSGPVWFLAGNGGGTSHRICTVPSGKALFFPLINWISIVPFDALTEEQARIIANVVADHTTTLGCTVDGVPLANLFGYRAESPTFPVTVGDIGWYPAGTYDTAMIDGYWLMLAPLSVGAHTIHFSAANNLPGNEWPPWSVYYGWDMAFSLDVTYEITVTPGAKK